MRIYPIYISYLFQIFSDKQNVNTAEADLSDSQKHIYDQPRAENEGGICG